MSRLLALRKIVKCSCYRRAAIIEEESGLRRDQLWILVSVRDASCIYCVSTLLKVIRRAWLPWGSDLSSQALRYKTFLWSLVELLCVCWQKATRSGWRHVFLGCQGCAQAALCMAT